MPERKVGMWTFGNVRRGWSVSITMRFLGCSDMVCESFLCKSVGEMLCAGMNESTLAGLRSVSNDTNMV